MQKQTFNHLTDLEVIEKWSDTINQHYRTRASIEAYLYKKYYPLCNVISRRYQSQASYEDNMQECYLIMLKALEYVNPQKTHNQAQYSFGVTFKQHLTSYFNTNSYESFNKQIEKNIVSIYQKDHNDNEVLIDGKVESHEEETVFALIVKDFKATLKESEMIIWNLLEEGKTYKEIAKLVNRIQVVHIIHRIKDNYKKFMNNNGYNLELN